MTIKSMTVERLLAYSSVIDEVINAIEDFYAMVMFSYEKGDLMKSELDEIHASLNNSYLEYVDTKNSIAKELQSRMKHDLKIKKGPSDIQNLLSGFVKKHPFIGSKQSTNRETAFKDGSESNLEKV